MLDELPRAIRILPTRLVPRAGIGAGLSLCSGLALYGPPPAGDAKLALIAYWAAIAAGAITAIGCAVRLVLQLPVIEASELGIAVWLQGPYHRPFFAPWSRVRSIVLTRTGPDGTLGGDSLGIELAPDDRAQLPSVAAAHGAPAGAVTRLAWSTHAISGDARRWVELLGRMKKAYDEPAA